MLNYAVCEIAGKQYKVVPGQEFKIDFQGASNQKELAAEVLLLSEDAKIELGKPYLKEKLSLQILENTKGEKIRVSKFHAKANFRRTTGIRPKFTRVILNLQKVA